MFAYNVNSIWCTAYRLWNIPTKLTQINWRWLALIDVFHPRSSSKFCSSHSQTTISVLKMTDLIINSKWKQYKCIEAGIWVIFSCISCVLHNAAGTNEIQCVSLLSKLHFLLCSIQWATEIKWKKMSRLKAAALIKCTICLPLQFLAYCVVGEPELIVPYNPIWKNWQSKIAVTTTQSSHQ